MTVSNVDVADAVDQSTLDLGDHVNFVPGTVMTIFSATAIIVTVVVYRTERTA